MNNPDQLPMPTLTKMEPPKRLNGSKDEEADRIVAFLKRDAGEWYRVRRNATRSGASVFKSRGCEATYRIQPDRSIDIFARWPVRVAR